MTVDRLCACPICQRPLEAAAKHDFEHGAYYYECPCCGRFTCTEESDDVLPRLSPEERVRLSGVARELSDRASYAQSAALAELRSDNIAAYLSSAPAVFDVSSKARKLLSAVARQTQQPGEWIAFPDAASHPLAYAAGFGEWAYLGDYCVEQGWLEKDRRDRSGNSQLRLTPAGWEEIQRRPRIDSDQGFVAMSFSAELNDAYTNGFEPAIEDCHFRGRRIDGKEYNQGVVDEIIAEIRESRFVVADVTEQKNGVYFEAGFAAGLGIPVIWSCRKDDAKNVHFDAAHFNQIRWESPEELRKKLAVRIRATIGLGRVSPPSIG